MPGYSPKLSGDSKTLASAQLDPVRLLLQGIAEARLPEVASLSITREGFGALTLRDGTSVRLGDEAWRRKLQYLPTALAHIRHKQRAAEYIDLTTLRAPVWKPVDAEPG